jgi:hypothetical protein
MSTLTLAAQVQNPDSEDRRAMEWLIDQENLRRIALDPPLATLPKSTAAERKASYEIILAAELAAIHVNMIARANDSVLSDPAFATLKPLWKDATPAQKSAAVAALGG